MLPPLKRIDKMKSKSMFLQFTEFDCRQVNVKIGRLYHYWFIEPNDKPIKTKKGVVPFELREFDLTELGLVT
tara:strand:+ start:1971 stop:2186 length:216 start_codon:yes stop_codon:yes gene_type:complete